MVLPSATFGSMAREPKALVVRPESSGVHVGTSARASAVLHTPPPAAATKRTQSPGTHVGAIASAVTRPELIVARSVKVEIAGTAGVTGPSSLHVSVIGASDPLDRADGIEPAACKAACDRL